MRTSGIICILAACALSLMIISGCSSDKKATNPTDNTTHPISLVDAAAIIEAVAPPAYTNPVAMPGTIDSAWVAGDWPLLRNVFGDNDPQTLYANIQKFRMNMDICESFLRVDANGNPVTGVVHDSIQPDTGDDVGTWFHITGSVSSLAGPVAIPAAAQDIVGTSVDLDYLITISIDEAPSVAYYLALKLTDTTQTFLQFFKDDVEKGETQMVYLNLKLADSTFDFRGIGYCAHPPEGEHVDTSHFCWGYNITSNANSDFAYRMSYASDGWGGGDMSMFKYLGGGNRNTEFAMRYREFHPADTSVCDSLHMYDAVFGQNYTEGSSLITAFDSYLDEDLFYPYSAIPEEPLPNPFE